MITFGTVLTVIAVVIVLVILFKLLRLITAALGISEPWGQISYWAIVLFVVIWLVGFLGIAQPIIR